MREINQAKTDIEIQKCFPVIQVLRPHLIETDFVSQVKKQQQQGYKLVFLSDEAEVKSVAGLRILETLGWGKLLYIDDLVTAPESRGKGYASHLIDWLIAEAIASDCEAIHLDSGYQRHDAHRFYLNKNFVLSAHHFYLYINK